MRRADAALIALICAIAAAVAFFGNFGNARKRQGEAVLVVTVDGELFGTYSLTEDRVVSIGNGNTFEISGGKVRMTDADCPDLDCVHSRALDASGGAIVCLPNRVILKIQNGRGEEYDTVAG